MPTPEITLTPAQRYYQAHKEERRAYGREYYAKNKDRILATIEAKKAKNRPPPPDPFPDSIELIVEPLEVRGENQSSPIAQYKRRGIQVREAGVVEFR